MAAAARRAPQHAFAAARARAAVQVHSMTAPADVGEPTELEGAKRRVREAVKAALRQLSAEQMAEESRAIAARVLASRAFREAPHAVIYVHCAKLREVDTSEVLRQAMEGRKRLYVPRVQDKDANMHFLHLDSLDALEAVPPFGIREPRPTYEDGSERQDVLLVDEPLELVVMPGLAFDRAGRRLGRGGGYYDKFIAAARTRAEQRGWPPPLLVALAFRAQLVEAVPVEPHDALVDAIVTADEIIACSPGAAEALAAWGAAPGSSGGGGNAPS
ncbi:hypothetical protein ABPG75_005172 [Micractinium tetrahymenae]